MKQTVIKTLITYTEPLLATASGNTEVHAEYIASKAPDHEKTEEELASLPKEEQLEKASTVFHRDETGLFTFDYHWRGYIKECIGHMCELGEFKKLSKWTFRRAVDGCIFASPRKIYLIGEDGKPILSPHGSLQRPLRAQTMQGERVALARSELVNPGTTQHVSFTLIESENKKSTWSEITPDVIRACLTLGTLKGHGQWRSGGYGRFDWKEA